MPDLKQRLEADDLRHPASFERAYRRCAGRARAAAARILHDDAAAEDVVHDVFLALWRNPGAFDPRRGSLSAYVTMVARSRALDHYRATAARKAAMQRNASHEAIRLRTPDDTDVAETVSRRERAGTMLDVLETLPREQRIALLASAHGLTSDEVAAANAIPLGTAKSRLRLGLLKARAALEAAA